MTDLSPTKVSRFVSSDINGKTGFCGDMLALKYVGTRETT